MTRVDPTSPFGHKVRTRHHDRLAVVYIRQSTPQQVVSNRESADLQYQLRQRAVALGWVDDRVLVIDDDQGISGASVANRPGFQRLLAEAATQQPIRDSPPPALRRGVCVRPKPIRPHPAGVSCSPRRKVHGPPRSSTIGSVRADGRSVGRPRQDRPAGFGRVLAAGPGEASGREADHRASLALVRLVARAATSRQKWPVDRVGERG